MSSVQVATDALNYGEDGKQVRTRLARIPYLGSFLLQALTPGHYLLRINIKDQSTKASAMQQAAFTIE